MRFYQKWKIKSTENQKKLNKTQELTIFSNGTKTMMSITQVNPSFFKQEEDFYNRVFHKASTPFGDYKGCLIRTINDSYLDAVVILGHFEYLYKIYSNGVVNISLDACEDFSRMAQIPYMESHTIDVLRNMNLMIDCNNIKVRYERMHEAARVPTRAHWNDAAYDLWGISLEEKPDGRLMYHTGLKIAMPDNYVGLVFPRSSTSKLNLILGNCVAVFDAGYRGEVMIPYKTLNHAISTDDGILRPQVNSGPPPRAVQVDPNTDLRLIYTESELRSRYEVSHANPQRIAQILFIPRTDVNWVEVNSVGTSDRGEGNFGHTGQQ
jgi:dUTP pyrophosphatase